MYIKQDNLKGTDNLDFPIFKTVPKQQRVGVRKYILNENL